MCRIYMDIIAERNKGLLNVWSKPLQKRGVFCMCLARLLTINNVHVCIC